MPQMRRKVDLPFLGEREIDVPLVVGASLATLGTLIFIAPRFLERYTTVKSAEEEKAEAEAALADPQISPQQREKYEKQLEEATAKIQQQQQQQQATDAKTQAEQQAANNPPVPHGSVVYGSMAIYPPYFKKEASTEQWKALLGLIEQNIQQNYYRGDGMYYGNESGEIVPKRGVITQNILDEDLNDLAEFIANGGTWIDYTDYPLWEADGRGVFGNQNRWNRFCLALSKLTTPEINKLGEWAIPFHEEIYSNFWVRNKFPEFAFERSLVVLRETPPRDYFVTSNMVTGLEHVPYDEKGAYSMFALRYKNGTYFYSSRGNRPYDYAEFIKTVHGFQI